MEYRKFSKKMFADEEGYESATPEIVADYRAERLKCSSVLDCCCGVGGDLIALGRVCDNAIAIEKSAERIRMAEKNVALYGLKNVLFINSDVFALDMRLIKQKYSIEHAFADPQRRRDGRRIDNLEETEPGTTKIISLLSKDFDGFCVEVSSNAEVKYDCEREYVSWDSRKGKRECILSLYFCSVKRCCISAVVLPGMERIEVNEPCDEDLAMNEPLSYLYEPKICIERAGIKKDLAKRVACVLYGPFLTSDKHVNSPFFENSFRFLAECDKSKLVEALNRFDAGKIVLRAKLQPDEHEMMKDSIEEKLNGTKKLHVFSLGERFLVCESLSIRQNARTQSPS